jgi:proline racemase
MCGAVLTEPTHGASDAGLLFMHPDGFSVMCGHAVIAVATIALERGLLVPRGDGTRVVFDTPAGTVRATVSRAGGKDRRIDRVSFASVPAFVLHPGVDVPLPGSRLRADVAFGGEFYAIVDAESAGVSVDGTRLGDLRRVGMAITAAVDAVLPITHPLNPAVSGLAGTIFTAPPQVAGADLRNAAVSAGGAVDRSPGGTGTAAVMAVLDEMGLLAEDRPFVHESIIGQLFEGRLAGRTRVGAVNAIVPEIAGAAYITGDHTFVVEDSDPLRDGFRLS